ncbi:MAG: hypothetical protein LBQ79_08610 [Deltaproteobacteria bacterium]|nr:hypothetical protein [Deltaproteobacteria bacterium]
MRRGCAGFFTPEALAGGRGLPVTAPEARDGAFDADLVADPSADPPSGLSGEDLDAVRRGDLSPFGPRFGELSAGPAPLPGGRLALVTSATAIDRSGGANGRGFIRCEAEVDPGAWYLRCHFPGDEVMPGTLMYDASLQALRIYLMSIGWIPGPGRIFVPTPGAPAMLKCRGQVLPGTRSVAYDVHVRELTLRPPDPGPASRRPGRPAKRPPEPAAVADAVMWADGRPIVEVTGMALTLAGGSLEQLAGQFRGKRPKGRPPLSAAPGTAPRGSAPSGTADAGDGGPRSSPEPRDGAPRPDPGAPPERRGGRGAAAGSGTRRSPAGSGTGRAAAGGSARESSGTGSGRDQAGVGASPAASGAPGGPPYAYPQEKVRLLSSGPVSGAFGPLFSRFDSGAFWPHMPQAPYDFMDEVDVTAGEVGTVADGSELTARHAMDPARWTFAEAGGGMLLPYAALNETALQPCGFLATFMGSYLPFPGPMHFRNLGGEAVTLRSIRPSDAGLLTTRATLERHSVLGETAIQHYRFTTMLDGETVYEGVTHFGFLSPENLARQEGLKLQRGEEPFPGPPPDALSEGYPRGPAWPSGHWRMLDRLLWERAPGGAPPERCWGRTLVRPGAWFFSAHFPQDPVWPGSLGLEAFFQAGKVLALRRFRPGLDVGDTSARFTAPVPGRPHRWLYRGQIVPVSRQCAVGLQVTGADDSRMILTFRGVLWADDLPIYRVDDFTVQINGI